MDKLLPGTAVLVALVAILILMYLGWKGRRRRQAALKLPSVPAAERGAVRLEVGGFYVASTTAGNPLDRLALPGLAFRGRVTVTVQDAGVAIAVQGEPDVFIGKDRIRSVGTSTWAIDRVVEQGGLVRLDWTIDGSQAKTEPAASATDVESYLRIADPADSTRLIDAVTALTDHPDTIARNQEGSLT